jgi:hypothetical protein
MSVVDAAALAERGKHLRNRLTDRSADESDELHGLIPRIDIE